MAVGLGEVNWRGGRSGVQGAMDGGAGIQGRWMGVQVIRRWMCEL